VKIVILGLPQAGQQELFSLLTRIPLDTIKQKPMEVQLGICEVRDPRVTKLIEMYNPAKKTYARIEYSLLPDFNLVGPSKDMIFNQLKNSDEICWVTRHETAADDIASFISELVIFDLMAVEKRLENIAKDQKKKLIEARAKEEALMKTCKQQLDGEKPLRDLKFSDDQIIALKTYQFLTMKPVFFVINVPEDKINDESISISITEKFSYPCIQVSAGLEEEISRMEKADYAVFMKEMGIKESALDKMNQMAFSGLGLISFFTVGTDEVKAWPVRKGALAPEAGSVIHSDIERGFVRAEMFKYDDLIAAGSEAKLKELGKYYLKGKDYLVQDGDILSFRVGT
jgi:ribosome-binding ATPase YchF (GTP1/OBG family)